MSKEELRANCNCKGILSILTPRRVSVALHFFCPTNLTIVVFVQGEHPGTFLGRSQAGHRRRRRKAHGPTLCRGKQFNPNSGDAGRRSLRPVRQVQLKFCLTTVARVCVTSRKNQALLGSFKLSLKSVAHAEYHDFYVCIT